jgi:hypothetical protein
MTTVEILLLIFLLAAIGVMVWMALEFRGMKMALHERAGINNETIKLRLQAYERLTLFVERCGLRNLVARLSPAGLSVPELHSAMLNTLHSEYEYNISQQMYVSGELWRALSNFKEQNVYILNQLAATQQPGAPGIALSKSVLELLSVNEKADLYSIVLEALRFEAQKIM